MSTPSPDHPAHEAVAHADGHSGCCGHTCAHGHEAAHSHDHDHSSEDAEIFTRRFFLFLELLVLLLWGLVMAWFYASGRIERYLVGEGMFRIQVLISGMALFVLGMFNWLMRARALGCGHDHGHGEEHRHEHGHDPGHTAGDCGHAGCGHAEEGAAHHHEGTFGGRTAALLLMAVPVTAAAAWTADDFSDDYKRNMLTAETSRSAPAGEAPEEFRLTPQQPAAGAQASSSSPSSYGGVTLELIEKYQPRNQNGNFELGVMQLYYSGSDPEYASVMKGQGVETTGQVVRDTLNPGPGRYRVFVLQVSCCAADARPYSVPVELTGPPVDVQEMGWYRITGKIDYVEERGVTIAVLRADSMQPTVRPRDQRMLF